MAEGQQLGRQIHTALKADHAERTLKTGEARIGHLNSGNVKEARHTLQCWYRKPEDRFPKPCYHSLENQTLKREQLYNRVQPPRDPIPLHIDQPLMDNGRPEDHEV